MNTVRLYAYDKLTGKEYGPFETPEERNTEIRHEIGEPFEEWLYIDISLEPPYHMSAAEMWAYEIEKQPYYILGRRYLDERAKP